MNAKHIYGCYRCGELEGEVVKHEDGSYACGSCGELSVVTFVQALDMLNAFYREGHFISQPEDELLEEALQIIEEEESDQAENPVLGYRNHA
jgi:hypothetical protein